MEKEANPKSLYLIAQQSGVECSAYFEHVQIRCFFSVLFFCYLQILFSSLRFPFFSSSSLYGWESVPGTQKKKERKSIEKRGGIKKSSLIFRFVLDFSIFFLSFSPLSGDAPRLAVAVVVAFVPRVSAHV